MDIHYKATIYMCIFPVSRLLLYLSTKSKKTIKILILSKK